MIASHCIRLAVLAAALAAVSAVPAAEVAGVAVAERLKAGDRELVLNGAGLRSRFFVKVYVGALHVAEKSASPAALVESTAPRRVTLRLLRDIDADTLYGALRDGLKDNSSESELAAVAPQVEEFAALMGRIGAAKSGDSIALDFAGDGVAVSHNGEVRGKVASLAFARALLRVWLGDKPVDASLKKALLGG